MSFYDKKFAGGMVTRFGKIQKFQLKQKKFPISRELFKEGKMLS